MTFCGFAASHASHFGKSEVNPIFAKKIKSNPIDNMIS